MDTEASMVDLVRVIQLSVAPVFLLTGVGALLNVLTGRLSRIIDRARALKTKLHEEIDESETKDVQAELQALKRRMKRVDLAITLCTTCALFICIVIVALFMGTVWHYNVSRLVVSLFVGAMLSLIVALVSFLQEILIATRSVRIGRN